jgi:N-acetylglucosamine-6-phosphate deacetylase
MTTLIARALHTANGTIAYPILTLHEGHLVSIESGEPNDSSEVLTSPFLDVHVHGAVGVDFMNASPAAMQRAAGFLASRGVAHYLPTTVTDDVDATLRALDQMAQGIEWEGQHDCAQPIGIHLEGPFLSHIRRGVHPPAKLQPPSIELFERFQQAARGQIKLMTLAPELPGAMDLLQHAVAQGVRVSLGHSDADWEQGMAAVEAGASSVTHTFNAMRPLHHRELGLSNVALDCNRASHPVRTSHLVYAELICDGVHVRPAMVRLWLQMKGANLGILVTDGIEATGMPDGEYTLAGMRVTVRDGVCLAGETLAGSVLTMDRAVENVQQFTGVALDVAARLASHNPAAMLGRPELGSLQPGTAAHFNVFSTAGRFVAAYRYGRRLGDAVC